jgi:hypothetical protein
VVDQGDGSEKSKKRYWVWAGVVAVLMAAALLYRPVLRQLRPEVIDVICQRAGADSAAMFTFLEERQALDPYPFGHPLAGVPADQQDAAWLEYLTESGSFQQETMAQFSQQFGAEVRFLIEGFKTFGAWPRGRQLDDRVVNELGIRDLATELGTAARRLDCPVRS